MAKCLLSQQICATQHKGDLMPLSSGDEVADTF